MLAFLIAFWQRPEITAVVMRHYRRMADRRKDMILVAVGSEGEESRRLASEYGWVYVEAPNRPLSDKLLAGLRCVRQLNPRSGMIGMGSDDLVTEAWIDRCKMSPRMLGLKDMYLVRRSTWEGLHWTGYVGPRVGESVGAHRFFPRRVLDRLGWDLWPRGLNCNLDGNLTRKLKILQGRRLIDPPRVLRMDEAGCAALGISSEVNITSWRHIAASPGAVEMPPEKILEKFPPETAADVRALRL